jgi:uncharacterized protein (DUF885 family)
VAESGLKTDSGEERTPDARTAHAPLSAADEALDALAHSRFDDVVARHPSLATFLGYPGHDHELSNGSREAVLDDAAEARRYLVRLEQIDARDLSPYFAVERDLALYATRRELFDLEVHRVWERRVTATDEIGDGIFLLLARGSRPLAERLNSIAARLEAAPRHIEQQKTRLGESAPVRLWNEMELEAVASLPSLFGEVVNAARHEFGDAAPEVTRLEDASRDANRALDDYAAWLREELGRATDEFALGVDAYDELLGLRAFDGLTGDDILDIGEEQLAEHRTARAAIAHEIDPSANERVVIDRIKSDHPVDFAAALAAYRTAMDEARTFVREHDLATLPPDEKLSVIETPEYLRNVLPVAAYFPAPKFDHGNDRRGIYVVTPSIDGDPRAMREHNHASIYNTSIHEAYPGHHHQLAVAMDHPSLVRVLVDAPEFVEGWAMYCEQMMREEGFDTSPTHRLMMHTDAIWRACRIILDVKLHRREIRIADAVEFMILQTSFERPQATAEVQRYTYTPSYELSYLLGRVLLLRLRDDERRRLGEHFSLRRFHDALLSQGSLPISFQRRLLVQGY